MNYYVKIVIVKNIKKKNLHILRHIYLKDINIFKRSYSYYQYLAINVVIVVRLLMLIICLQQSFTMYQIKRFI